jgi:hypothetical protein
MLAAGSLCNEFGNKCVIEFAPEHFLLVLGYSHVEQVLFIELGDPVKLAES